MKIGILPELEVAKKCKVDESVKVSEKEQKIMQVAEICGVELPYGDRSKNFQSGTFETCSTTWCREQYGTTKALLDGVAQTGHERFCANSNGASTSCTEGVC